MTRLLQLKRHTVIGGDSQQAEIALGVEGFEASELLGAVVPETKDSSDIKDG